MNGSILSESLPEPSERSRAPFYEAVWTQSMCEVFGDAAARHCLLRVQVLIVSHRCFLLYGR